MGEQLPSVRVLVERRFLHRHMQDRILEDHIGESIAGNRHGSEHVAVDLSDFIAPFECHFAEVSKRSRERHLCELGAKEEGPIAQGRESFGQNDLLQCQALCEGILLDSDEAAGEGDIGKHTAIESRASDGDRTFRNVIIDPLRQGIEHQFLQVFGEQDPIDRSESIIILHHIDGAERVASDECRIAYGADLSRQGDALQFGASSKSTGADFGNCSKVLQFVEGENVIVSLEHIAEGCDGSRLLHAQFTVAVGVEMLHTDSFCRLIIEDDIVERHLLDGHEFAPYGSLFKGPFASVGNGEGGTPTAGESSAIDIERCSEHHVDSHQCTAIEESAPL